MPASHDIARSCHCSRLRAASRSVTRLYDEALRPLGLKGNQLTVLVAASLMQPVSISALAEQLQMERTTLTRNLGPLEARGYAAIASGPGRARRISVTQAGMDAIETAKPRWDETQKRIERAIDPDALAAMEGALERLAKA